MKKIKELLKFKYLMYLLVSFSWVFLLTMVYELNENLKDANWDTQKIHSIDDKLYSLGQQLEEINDKLEYEYNSVDEGNYESIQHYRINKETGKIQKQNSWGSGW
jgi:hypothetical protein